MPNASQNVKVRLSDQSVQVLILLLGSQFLQNPRHDVSFERRFSLSRRLFADDKRKGTDYIDENPEIQKILRDLYDEPKHEKGLLAPWE